MMPRILSVLLALASFPAMAAEQASPGVAAQVAAGRLIFETSCASSMCHGSGGVGGEGPGLLDTNLSLSTVIGVVQRGRPGTPMAPFGELLDPDMQAQVIAFVMSLTSGGRAPEQVVKLSAPPSDAAPSLSDLPETVMVGDGEGRPVRGHALFYDTSRVTGCRACHRVYGNGGPVGIDLADLALSPLEIYAAAAAPKMASDHFPRIELTTSDGVTHEGVKHSEDHTVIRYFDVSTPLPVLRTILLEDITDVDEAPGGTFDHTALGYSKQEVLDLAAFIHVMRRR